MLVESVWERARLHAALGDPHRLALVDELLLSDRSPSELGAAAGIDSNLLAHHLRVLEEVGLVERITSEGDRRRRYVRLLPGRLAGLLVPAATSARRVVFVCTGNSARSQLAEAIWNRSHDVPSVSGGTHPAARIHPAAVRAAARRGLDLTQRRPAPLPRLRQTDLVVTVCDRAHEELASSTKPHQPHRLHWSVPDPVLAGRQAAFNAAADEIADRIGTLAPLLHPA